MTATTPATRSPRPGSASEKAWWTATTSTFRWSTSAVSRLSWTSRRHHVHTGPPTGGPFSVQARRASTSASIARLTSRGTGSPWTWAAIISTQVNQRVGVAADRHRQQVSPRGGGFIGQRGFQASVQPSGLPGKTQRPHAFPRAVRPHAVAVAGTAFIQPSERGGPGSGGGEGSSGRTPSGPGLGKRMSIDRRQATP